MNYLLVTDHKTSEPGKALMKLLEAGLTERGLSCSSVALDKKDCFSDIQPFFLGYPADMVITADMAGCLAVNKQGETVYNSMYCRCLHILTREPWHFHVGLLRRMNFTAQVITAFPWEKEYLERHYETVPDTYVLPVLAETSGMRTEAAAQIKKGLDRKPKVFSSMAAELMKGWKKNSILPEEILNYLKRKGVSFSEEELLGLTVLFKDLPDYFKPPFPEDKGGYQCSEELINCMMSLILAE